MLYLFYNTNRTSKKKKRDNQVTETGLCKYIFQSQILKFKKKPHKELYSLKLL